MSRCGPGADAGGQRPNCPCVHVLPRPVAQVACAPPTGLLESLQQSITVNEAVPAQLLQDFTVFSSSVHRDAAFLRRWRPVGPVLCAEIKPKAGCLSASWP